MSVKKYRQKPVTIEAIQWTGENFREVTEFMNYFGDVPASDKLMQIGQEFASKNGLAIHTLEGNMLASVGDFIIKGVNGGFQLCRPNVFVKNYEKVFDTIKNTSNNIGKTHSVCRSRLDAIASLLESDDTRGAFMLSEQSIVELLMQLSGYPADYGEEIKDIAIFFIEATNLVGDLARVNFVARIRQFLSEKTA